MPNILSPANGSVVPPVFDVIWNFPLGIVPGGLALRSTWSAGGVVDTEADVVDPNSFRVTALYPPGALGKGKMTIGASHGQFSPIDFTAVSTVMLAFARRCFAAGDWGR